MSAANLSRSEVRTAWILLAPMLVTLALVAGWPLLRTIWFGFTDARLGESGNFVGFDNYLADFDGEWFGVLADRLWWRSVWNTLWFTAVSVSIETLLGTVVALVLNAAFPGRALVRAVILIPWAIPTVVSARIWNWMLHDQFGILNDALMRLGILSAPIAWTADPETALWAVVMVDVWKTTPFMALLILAGLQMLPRGVLEAARIDGAGPVTTFFRIVLPLIRPVIMVAVIFRALDSLRVFDLIYVLTSNAAATMSMSVYARQQLIDFQEVGLGSAAATMIFVIVSGLTVLYIGLGRVRLGERPR